MKHLWAREVVNTRTNVVQFKDVGHLALGGHEQREMCLPHTLSFYSIQMTVHNLHPPTMKVNRLFNSNEVDNLRNYRALITIVLI